jgi:hypothetical protein
LNPEREAARNGTDRPSRNRLHPVDLRKQGSTPDASKRFQLFRIGLISMIVIGPRTNRHESIRDKT